MMLPPRNPCFAATLTEKLNISRGFAQNTQKVFWTETQLCWMRDNDHKDSFCLKTPLWMNVSNAAILKGVKKKKKTQQVHPLALSYSNFQTILQPESTQEMWKLGGEASLNAVSFSDVVNIINILSLSRLPVCKVKEPRKQWVNIVTSQGKGKTNNRQRSL